MGFKEDTLKKSKAPNLYSRFIFSCFRNARKYGLMIPLEIKKYIFLWKFIIYKIFVRLLKIKLYRYIT